MWLSQRYNSLTFELIFHKSVQPRYLLLTCILETNVVSLPSVVHLGLQLVCVTVDVAEAGNKMSLTPNFRGDHGRFRRNSQECRDVGQLVGFRIVDPDIRGSLGSTLHALRRELP